MLLFGPIIYEFNSFFPMEIIATQEETENIINEHKDASYLIFPEYREYPIKMTNDLPKRWINKGANIDLTDTVMRGEYYTFQIGVFSISDTLRDVQIEFSNLSSTDNEFNKKEFICFNNGGVNYQGEDFELIAPVDKKTVKSFWCGIQLPDNMEVGSYTATITVKPYKAETKSFKLNLYVDGQVIADANDSKPELHSRLRWLNSKIASDKGIVPPYKALMRKDSLIQCLGRDVILSESGFPRQIRSYFNERMTGLKDTAFNIISKPIKFKIENPDYSVDAFKPKGLKFLDEEAGVISWKATNTSELFDMELTGRMEFDGCIEYKVVFIARKDAEIKDIKMKIPVDRNVGQYMMGMGFEGGKIKPQFSWKWDKNKNQDAIWVGKVNAGLQLTMWGDNYERPLNADLYHNKPLNMPKSWYNNGNGGCKVDTRKNVAAINIFSGERKVLKGQILNFNFRLLITPFRTIDTKKQWETKYYHAYNSIREVKAVGANTINIENGTEINPYFNYPFLSIDKMKQYVEEAHDNNLKVKLHYTPSELSNRTAELFALQSLGDEILAKGNGKGHSWLQEHFSSGYISGNYNSVYKNEAVVNSSVSRWHNYYVEGLNWLVKNIKIDGLYIDKVAFDRKTMQRVRKILDRNRTNALIDLYATNQYNEKNGYASTINLYLEHLPYVDRLWFGNDFDYDANPDYWLIEMSGIPFGTMGEMRQQDGNFWRGMLYGMTNRYPLSEDPESLWEALDMFGIKDSEMIGYWTSDCPVKTSHEKVLTTVYKKDKKVLLSVASWGNEKIDVKLDFDWKALGINPEKARLTTLVIRDVQKKVDFKITDKIPVEPKKGWLLILEEK